MKRNKKELLDQKVKEACNYTFFDVARESRNDQMGLPIGTAVKKITEPMSRPSRYNSGVDYWTVRVECPNGEIRTVGVEALDFRKTQKPFVAQQRAFNFKFKKKK